MCDNLDRQNTTIYSGYRYSPQESGTLCGFIIDLHLDQSIAGSKSHYRQFSKDNAADSIKLVIGVGLGSVSTMKYS
jgi:hypothetical protein